MSASEFSHWLAFAEKEPFGLGYVRATIARMMAALHNGPLLRKDKRTWSAEDFGADPWAEPKELPHDAESLKRRFGRR